MIISKFKKIKRKFLKKFIGTRTTYHPKEKKLEEQKNSDELIKNNLKNIK
jgi:hypothetical protein